ncbi:MAG: hypothetical protein HYU87_00765 [Chloroflexi bacterium]|nr:hypothetical protein [Chloroflexota bacterium]
MHHKNGRRDDNRPENLELWRQAQPSGVRAADYHCPGCQCDRSRDVRTKEEQFSEAGGVWRATGEAA